MKKIVLGALALVAIIAAIGFANRERFFLSAAANDIETRSLDDLKAFLAPSIRYFPPEGVAPPYPVVMQLHGCAGYRDGFMRQWAAVANAAGYMAIAVDSNGPRGIDYETSLQTVCRGEELIGLERAADILAAWDIVTARDDVDTDNIVVAGWSHGAWTLMDVLALSAEGKPMPSFATEVPVAFDPSGIILFYPYCGPGAWSRLHGWNGDIEAIAFVAGEDQIVNGPQCKALLEKIGARGPEIDLIYYPTSDHVFDDRTLSPENQHYFDPQAADDAQARYGAFLTSRFASGE